MTHHGPSPFSSPLLRPATPAPPLHELCARIHARISAFLGQRCASERLTSVQSQTRASLGVVADALDRYSLPELSLSYNGGKDCLVLLILCLHVLHARSQRQPSLPAQPGQDPQDQHQHTATSPLQCVYIQAPHPFAEVEAFVAESTRAYSLRLATYAKPMKAAFADYLRDRPAVRAVFVGTRRTDPHAAHLSHFDPTDHGWPPFLRIHPVIDWHYADIWTFIRHLHISYCPLYDKGYTSLGGTTDTHPNPALLISAPLSDDMNGSLNEQATPTFRPAYELEEDEAERLGRDR